MAALGFLDTAPLLQQLQGTNGAPPLPAAGPSTNIAPPSPAQSPQGTPPQQPFANSPIHAHTAAILSRNPQATAQQIGASLGVSPAIAAKVMSDLHGITTTAGPPPINAAAQAMQPIAPPSPRPNLPPALAQGFAPVAPPNGSPLPGPSSPATAPPGSLSAAAGAPPPGAMPPPSAASPPSTAPGAPPQVAPNGSPAQEGGSPIGNWLSGSTDRLATQNASAAAPPGAWPTPLPASQNGAPPAASRPTFLQELGRLLPTLAVALASSKNPQVGAGILQGAAAGEQQNKAEAAQKAEIARQQAQQQFQNTQQQFENTQATTATTDKETQQQFENRQTFMDDLLKRDPVAQEQQVKNLSDSDASAMGIDKASFYGPDGKFIPQTPAEKALDPVALARVQASNFDKLQGLTADSQKNIHDSMDEAEWKATYGVPYDNFTPVQRAKDATAEEKARTAQQRVDDAAKLIGPKIAQINAEAGLSKSKTNYNNLTTPERVKIYQATARLLGIKANDQNGLDLARIAYEKATGNAAAENAITNRVNSQTKAALTNADIDKIAADTQYTKSRIQQVAAKDPYFTAAVQERNKANDLKAKALASTTYDPPTRARIIAGYDADIHRADQYINSRMAGTGSTTAPPPDTGTQTGIGTQNHVPIPPSIAPPLQGKQTPRSAAWAAKRTFGGSQPTTVMEGRKLGKMFGFTDIGGTATTGHTVDSDHYTGNALDFMIHGDKNKGQELANYAAANAAGENVKYIIWNKQIWSPQRASEGWRPYDGPSPHTDHVHISFLPGGPGAPPATASAAPVVSPPAGTPSAGGRPNYHAMSTSDLIKLLANKIKG